MGKYKRLCFIIYAIFSISVAVITIWHLKMPPTASEETRYTLLVLFKYADPVWLVLTIGYIVHKLVSLIKGRKKLSYGIVIGSLICLLVPMFAPPVGETGWQWGILYSALWAIGAFGLGLGCFTGAIRLNNAASSFLVIAGTLLIVWSVAEAWYLCTPQNEDGKYMCPKQSKYVLANEAQPGWGRVIEKKFGDYNLAPDHPARAVGMRERVYNTDLYDVKYSYDVDGNRITPKAQEKPLADLLLFGCSFTFGYGLEDEQTWAWKLGKDLGPTWQLFNYGHLAWGAQQMLGMLEYHELSAVPDAPVREALFLTLRHHLLRPTGAAFAIKSLNYKLENGKLEHNGYSTEQPLSIIPRIRSVFNGSQSVRALANAIVSGYLARNIKDLLQIYAATIIQSAEILKNEYATRLTVLIWPDMEDLAPLLQARDISFLFVRNFLKDWNDDDETIYHIYPEREVHPNDKATTELAAGLAAYYRKLCPQAF